MTFVAIQVMEASSARTFIRFNKLNQIDADKGIIKDIVILNGGLTKNYTYHDDQFLQDLVSQGNEDPEKGIPSRFGHPNDFDSKPIGFIGRYKNFSFKTDGQDSKVLADLHLSNMAKTLEYSKDKTFAEYILELAEEAPDAFGNSIYYHYKDEITYVDSKGNPVDTANDFELLFQDDVYPSYKLESFDFSDLVDVPGGTNNLFESKKTNNKKQNDMLKNVLSRLTKLESKKGNNTRLNDELTLADNTAVEAVPNLAIGNRFQLAENSGDVEDAAHVLADGRTITTEASVITDIQAGATEEPTEAPPEEMSEDTDKDKTIEALNAKVEKLEESVAKIADVLTNSVSKNQEDITELTSKVKGLSLTKPVNTGVPTGQKKKRLSFQDSFNNYEFKANKK